MLNRGMVSLHLRKLALTVLDLRKRRLPLVGELHEVQKSLDKARLTGD